MRRVWVAVSAVLVTSAALGAAGCGSSPRDRDRVERRDALRREVAGLRRLAASIERGEPVVPPEDVAIAIDDSLVRALLSAQLPFETDIERFRVRLTQVEVQFHGIALVRLRGEAWMRERRDVSATLDVRGSLDDVTIDSRTGMLRARLVLDEIGIEKAAGLESWLSRRTLDALALALREQLLPLLPPIEIPVRVQQRIELRALTTGPVLIQGGAMPVRAEISRVVAGQGRLWIGVRLQPGEVARGAAAAARADGESRGAR